jgi:hypothetical protein
MAVRDVMVAVALVGVAAVAGCGAGAQGGGATEVATEASAVAPASLKAAAGAAAETLQPVPADDEGEANGLAGVVKFDVIPNQTGEASARLIGTAGGDPAANGLMTYLVFSTVHQSVVYPVGNIIDYRILGASQNVVDLEISQSEIAEDGSMTTVTRNAVLSWTPIAELESPEQEIKTTVTLTPAG